MTAAADKPLASNDAALREQLLVAGVRPGQIWIMPSPMEAESGSGVAFIIGGFTTTQRDDTLLVQLRAPHNTIRNGQTPKGPLPGWWQPRPGCSDQLMAAADLVEHLAAGRVIHIRDWHRPYAVAGPAPWSDRRHEPY